MSDVSGKSVLDLLRAQLDEYVEEFQSLIAKATNWDTRNQSAELASAKGAAHAAAVMLATVLNPYEPDVAAVKDEALERWENAHDEPEPVTPVREDRLARRAARRARREARNK